MFWFPLFILLTRLTVASSTTKHSHHFSIAPSCQPATSQFSVLNSFPTAVLIHAHKLNHRPFNTRILHPLLFFILLAGDIELNPGPTFDICTLNVRSLTNSLHKASVFDLATCTHPDIFALRKLGFDQQQPIQN